MSDMGYIEKLLDRVEVEWKPLAEVAEYSKTRISFDFLDEKNYVGVDNLLQNRAGKTESNYLPTDGNFTEYRSGDILIGNIRPYLRKIWHADRVGGTNGDVLVIHPTDEVINPRYLYQVLTDEKFFGYNMQHAKGAKMPRGNKAKIMEYSIPIPCPNNPEKSLEIQTEIVSILDAFTELTTELTTELSARKKQYNYYRDQLLSFEEGEVEWKALGEIATFSQGIQVNVSNQFSEKQENFVRFLRIVDFVKDNEPPRYIKNPGQRYMKEDGDLVMIRYGASAAGKVFLNHSGAIANNMFKINLTSEEITTKFLYSYLAQPKIYNYLNSGGGVSTMPAITFGQIGAVNIPIPPIAEQARIVAILDKFDTLTHSISEGLPREIELRQKQYEYYRNLLLSFPQFPSSGGVPVGRGGAL